MKAEFELLEKSFTSDDGKPIRYYVLSRQLIDGSVIEISIKPDKAKLLLMSLKLEEE